MAQDLAILLLRLVLGLLFIGHGTQKLFGWFGGGGLEATQKNFSYMNVYPVRLWTVIASLSEALGGLGLVVGLLTPLAAAAIIGVMLMATIKVHWKNGIWNTNKGYELNLMNIAVAAAIGLIGPGRYSLDALLGLTYPPLTFLIALVIVILGVIAGIYSGQVFSQRPEQGSGRTTR